MAHEHNCTIELTAQCPPTHPFHILCSRQGLLYGINSILEQGEHHV